MTAWLRVTKFNARALELANRHYSRQSPNSRQFMPPGKTLVLLTLDGLAVWGVCVNLDPAGKTRARCTIFRNEGQALSSGLIREATTITHAWLSAEGVSARLETEVAPSKVRRKRDPGRCFRRAGWTVAGKSASHRHRGNLVFRSPA